MKLGLVAPQTGPLNLFSEHIPFVLEQIKRATGGTSTSAAAAPFLGLAGAIITLQKLRISPAASFSIIDWTVFVIFIVVIGDIGSLEGPILGTILFSVLREHLATLGTCT